MYNLKSAINSPLALYLSTLDFIKPKIPITTNIYPIIIYTF